MAPPGVHADAPDEHDGVQQETRDQDIGEDSFWRRTNMMAWRLPRLR
jgi:hypothetical protein